MRRLVFVTKNDCPLCDAGLSAVRHAARWLRYDVTVTHVDDDASFGVYAERVPLVLSDDEVVLEGSIDLPAAVTSLLRLRFLRS